MLERIDVAGLTNTERIEANTTAIRSIECNVAVHQQRLETVEGRVDTLADGHVNLRELTVRIDERLSHLERSVDRIWKLLLTLVIAVIIEVVRRVLMDGAS